MIADINTVNFDDVDDAAGFATLLLSQAHRQDLPIADTARRWLNAVTPRITVKASPAYGCAMTDAYDLVYRLAYRQAPHDSVIEHAIMRAFDARLHGDDSVDQYMLYRNIDFRLKDNSPAKAMAWRNMSLERWWANFRYGRSLAPLSTADTLQQTAILLTGRLDGLEADPSRFKQRLFVRHAAYLDRTADMTPRELSLLDRFLAASSPYLSPARLAAHSRAILSALRAHPATNPFHRLSLQ